MFRSSSHRFNGKCQLISKLNVEFDSAGVDSDGSKDDVLIILLSPRCCDEEGIFEQYDSIES